MSDERKKSSPTSGESEAAVKQGPMDDTEVEGVVGGTGSRPRGSDHDPASSGWPDNPYDRD